MSDLLTDLKTRLQTVGYDVNYQDIECLDIHGYDRSEPTWLKIANDLNIDFVGKSVCDLGCFHGYYAMKAEQAGASRVIGLDRSEDILETARMISEASSSSVEYMIWESRQQTPRCDIALVLNMLHHCPDQELTLQNIECEEAVFEVNADQIATVNRYFDIIQMVTGREYPQRDPRILLYCRKR